MRMAVMQPYFFPYFGYFQLIAAVDVFIVYDNIEYTKKGWINRNRMLRNGRDVVFSIPLRHDSDRLNVCQRELASAFDRDKLINQLKEAYRRAPYFSQTFPLIEKVLRHADINLFGFLHHSIVETCKHLGVMTEVRISSGVAIDLGLRNQEKVLALCGAVGATEYVNASGGRLLYDRKAFRSKGIELTFIESQPFTYRQFGGEFVPWLSIVDVMMFNSLDSIQSRLSAVIMS